MNSRNIKAVFIMAIMLLNLGILFSGKAYADANSVEVPLSVTQTFEVENAEPEKINRTGTYSLIAVSQDAPMPDSENNIYTFSIDGSGKNHVIALTYAHGGTYKYSLKQDTADAQNYVYDRTEYTLTVYIKNTDDGKLVFEVIVENGSGKKCSEINFVNRYKGKDPVPPQKGDTVKTGDENMLSLWIISAAASALMLMVLIRLNASMKRKAD